MTQERAANRRVAAGFAAVATVVATGLAGCGQVAPTASVVPTSTKPTSVAPSGAPSSAPTSTATADGSCAALAASLTPAERAGQLIVVGVRGTLDAAERAVLTKNHAGAVILMGGASAKDTAAAVRAVGATIGVAVTVDQEGGRVQRFKGDGFDTIPSAREQATLTTGELEQSWVTWGGQLRDAGIDLTFAPVADVVPASKTSTNEPVGKLKRGYGSDPAVVGEKVSAVVRGLAEAGVGSSVKHFPGLGEVVGNTDFAAGVVDSVTGADSASLGSFRAGIAAGAPSVMVATATYTRIDKANLAAFSPAVMTLLRDDLGFDGVIASDDLAAAKAVSSVPAGQRAVKFVRAGGDWVVAVEPAAAAAMAEAVAATAASDAGFARRVSESATRVLELKAGLGLASCRVVKG